MMTINMQPLTSDPPSAQRLSPDQAFGGWAGKCLGGAIGMPYEGVPGVLALGRGDIVVQDVPNDDLELQLVWLVALEKYGLDLTSEHLAHFWTEHIRHGCDEYSIAIRNLRRGIRPPESGQYDNWFHDGMGAAIRSEIWAMAFPGRPDAAAHFAEQDAVVDHWRDGVWAEVFLAMAESRAIVTGEVGEALRFAYARLPEDSRLARGLALVFELFDAGAEAEAARREILRRLSHHNFTDCVMNLGFIAFALLWGGSDFLRTVLLAVNCGRDTDCTAATCGAMLGLACGTEAVPKDLLGRLSPEIRLSPNIAAVPGVPRTIGELCERTVALHERLAADVPEYPAYSPLPESAPDRFDKAQWLVLDDAGHDVPAIRERLLREGRCPEELRPFIVENYGLRFDLSAQAREANTLHLFSFLEAANPDGKPEDVCLSATADVGFTLWLDRQRVLNHHSRQLAIPSFHRTEGGAAFHYPLRSGDLKLVHFQLYSCLPPLGCTLMFGNQFNDHLDGFLLKMP